MWGQTAEACSMFKPSRTATCVLLVPIHKGMRRPKGSRCPACRVPCFALGPSVSYTDFQCEFVWIGMLLPLVLTSWCSTDVMTVVSLVLLEKLRTAQ